MKKSIKVLSLVAATLLMTSITGCDSTATSTSIQSGKSTNISDPKGQVTGLVQDTNGNPIEGVKVYLAGQTTTTDAGGNYFFKDVRVSAPEMEIVENEGTDVYERGSRLSITIAAPDGYLGATVTVRPNAVLQSSGESATNGVSTFIDGFLAQAGTAVLPELNADVMGTLRDETTGAALADTQINLDLIGGGSYALPQEQLQDRLQTTYAVTTYSATTDAEGRFNFTNIPSDAKFTASVPGYTLNHFPSFNTNAEETLELGNQTVDPIIALDTKTPYVISVNGTLGDTATRQMLEDDVRKTFVINFSEKMNIENDKDYTSSVIVKAGMDEMQMGDIEATITIAADNKSITVELTNELSDAEFLDINLLVTDFKDIAGNFVAEAAAGQAPDIAYDTLSSSGRVLKLKLQGFNDINTEAPAVEVLAQQDTDANTTPKDFEELQSKSNAFKDVENDTGYIEQMNSNTSDTAQRLSALGSVIADDSVSVLGSTARVTFTPTGAASYVLEIVRAGVEQALTATDIKVEGDDTVATLLNKTSTALLLIPTDTTSLSPIEFVISDGVSEVGDDVRITPLDELDYMGTPTNVTLVDNVAPTTVLQYAYGLGDNSNSSDTVVQYGRGGEISENSGSKLVGTPYLPVTPGLLDNLDKKGNALKATSTDNGADQKLGYEIGNKNTINTTTKKPYIDGKESAQYDTAGWAAFNTDASLARTVGIAFSEDIDLNGMTKPAYNGTVTVNNAVVNNNVVKTSRYNPTITIDEDLINVHVSNVIKLANIDNRSVVDFTGIKDAAGNTATASSNAKVVVLDKMPPLVTSAKYDAKNIILTFNEAVRLKDSESTVTIDSLKASYKTKNSANWTLSSDAKTLTISHVEFPGININNFTLGRYNEPVYGKDDYRHGNLTHNIADTHGNEWKNENSGVSEPYFLVAEMIGSFNESTDTSGFKVKDDTTEITQTVVWTFSHPIRKSNFNDLFYAASEDQVTHEYVIDGATKLSKINEWFEGFIDDTNQTTALTYVSETNPTSVTLSADETRMTLKFTTASDITKTKDRIRMKNGKEIVSSADSTLLFSDNDLYARPQ